MNIANQLQSLEGKIEGLKTGLMTRQSPVPQQQADTSFQLEVQVTEVVLDVCVCVCVCVSDSIHELV